MNQIVGNPVPYTVGRKMLLVSFVSMSEWQVFGELLKQNETQAVMELVFYSLRRGGGAITKRGIRRLARWHSTKLLPLIELICEISLPELKSKGSTPANADTEDAERNLKTVFRLLSRQHGWTPIGIGKMSPAQVYIYLMGGPDATGTQKMSGAEYQSFRAQRGL